MSQDNSNLIGLLVAVDEEVGFFRPRLRIEKKGCWERFPFWQGGWEGRSVVLVKTNPGPSNARAAALALLKHCQPALLLSSGLCAGLVPELSRGDVVACTRFLNGHGLAGSPEPLESFDRARELLKPEGFQCLRASFVNSAQTVVSAQEKQELAKQTGAQAVDMESDAVAAVAAEHGLPWASVRVVSDTCFETFPLDFNKLLKSNGDIDRFKVALEVLRCPRLLRDLWQVRTTVLCAGANLVRFMSVYLQELKLR